MPATVEVIDLQADEKDLLEIFNYWQQVEDRFSTFKTTSEISKINRGEIREENFSPEMKTVLALSEETKKLTNGYFDIITKNGQLDPLGLVKGWAIQQAAERLIAKGFNNFCLEIGGDIQVRGKNSQNQNWQIGIRNPFNLSEIVKVIVLGNNEGVATSGTYVRGEHIYNPRQHYEPATEIISLTVIGPNVYEADRFATAAFAMGEKGIGFIENLAGFEGYMIDKNGVATMTSGLN